MAKLYWVWQRLVRQFGSLEISRSVDCKIQRYENLKIGKLSVMETCNFRNLKNYLLLKKFRIKNSEDLEDSEKKIRGIENR